MQRRPLISLGAALCLAAGFVAAGAHAQSYPAKPIRLSVPSPVGGATDLPKWEKTITERKITLD